MELLRQNFVFIKSFAFKIGASSHIHLFLSLRHTQKILSTPHVSHKQPLTCNSDIDIKNNRETTKQVFLDVKSKKHFKKSSWGI